MKLLCTVSEAGIESKNTVWIYIAGEDTCSKRRDGPGPTQGQVLRAYTAHVLYAAYSVQ